MKRSLKRKTDKVIKEAFWEGFWCCMGGDPRNHAILHYVSDSSYYRLNGVRDIAWKAGSDMCERLLERRKEVHRVFPPRMVKVLTPFMTKAPEIPGSVYAECYGMMQIAHSGSENV